MIFIYCITNKCNGKKYFGQTLDIEKRFRRHVRKARHGYSVPLARAIRKYGAENFKIEKICSCSSRKQANEEEINRIRLARNNGSALYNVTIGGEGFVGCKHRKETCKKIALSLNARSNEEKDIWRKQISKALKGKMSALLTGRTLSVEHRINIGKGIKESRRNNSAQLM